MERKVFWVEGGIGKNIIATAVVKSLYKTCDELAVVGSHPDVWNNNPYVKRFYPMHNPMYMFEDWLMDGKGEFVKQEPYTHPDYVAKKRHMADCWCEMVDCEFIDEQPEIYLNPKEEDWAKDWVSKLSKPLFLLQGSGGVVPKMNNNFTPKEALQQMWRRAIPEKAQQEVVNKLKEKYTVVNVGLNQFTPKGSYSVQFGLRNWFALIPHVEKALCCDSFLQHAMASFNKEATVVWGGTSHITAGYKCHKNLTKVVCSMPNCHRPYTHLADIGANGRPWECPFKERCLDWTADEILTSLGE